MDIASNTVLAHIAIKFSSLDAPACAVILAGVLCQIFHKRLPQGLGTSLFVFTITLGLGMAVFGRDWPARDPLTLTAILGGALAALWAFFGKIATYGSQANAGQEIAGSAEAFFSWSLVSGIATSVIITYVWLYAVGLRLLDPDHAADQQLDATGLFTIAAMLCAALLWTTAGKNPQQPALLLALAALLVAWSSLMIPMPSLGYTIPRQMRSSLQPSWWTWTFQLQIGLSLLLLFAALLQDTRYRHRRKNAWPDKLDDLIAPYSQWPVYPETEAVIASIVLLLGVYQIVRAGPTGWELRTANGVACLIAAVTCLYMAYRRWSGNTAELGIALLTTAVVSWGCSLSSAFEQSADIEYADRIPILFNAILFSLWLLMGLWSWLAGFWKQQLNDGRAWTTTGRMIPYADRTAFMLIAIGALIAFQMALWPAQGMSTHADDSLARILCGAIAIALLALGALRRARRRNSTPVATLSVAIFVAMFIFVFLRLPVSPLRGWLIQYNGVVLSALALPTLLVAELIVTTTWRSFAAPLWFMALLVLPSRAMLALLSPERLPSEWVQPMTLAVLGALYGFAGSRERRRAFLVLAAVLLLAAGISVYRLYRSYGAISMPAF